MVILNSGITIQDKQGNKLSSASLSSFWGEFPGLSNVFDPKVIYDPLADRFLAVAVANRRASDSAILLAVSATSDPTDPWGQWLFDADPGGTTWLDFPYIGMTQDKITFTANLFTNADDTFLGSAIWAVAKSTALDGGAITTTSFSNSGEAAPAPALTYDAGVTTQFMLTQISSSFGGMGVLQLSMISGTATSPTFSLSSDFILGKQWNPTFPDAPQQGSVDKIETNDDRTQNTVLRNGRLWATHTAALPASGTATVTAAQWWEVDPFSSTAIQSGQEFGSSPDFFAYFPSIAVNANNEVLIGFSGSSAEVSVGSYFVQRDDSMPLGTMGPITAIKEQTGLVMVKTRWGDYSATHVDPVDDTTMWTIQLIAGASNRYTTWWAKFSGSSAPRVLDAVAINLTTVRLTYSKAMTNNAALIDPAIYQFTGGPPALIAESVTRVDSDTVDISVNSMGIGLSYTLTVSPGPTDLSGTPLDPSANSIVFIAEPAPLFQLPLGNQIQFVLLTLLGITGALIAGRVRPSGSKIL